MVGYKELTLTIQHMTLTISYWIKEIQEKRINVKVDYETHKKLRVVSAIQERFLDKIVGSIIENEIGAENNIGTVKLMNEILEFSEDEE